MQTYGLIAKYFGGEQWYFEDTSASIHRST